MEGKFRAFSTEDNVESQIPSNTVQFLAPVFLAWQQRMNNTYQMHGGNIISDPVSGAKYINMFQIKSAQSLQVCYSALITI